MSTAASESEDWSSHMEESDSQRSEIYEPGHADQELLRINSKAVEELNLDWSPPTEPERNRLDEWLLQPSRRREASPQRPAPFFPEVHEEVSKMWHAPYSARAHISGSALLTSVDRADLRSYSKLPPTEEAIAAHLCPSASLRVKSAAVHPNKSCRTTANITGKVYVAAGQAASALHSMAVLQVSQAKMLKHLDEQGPDPEIFRELRSTTDLALQATKMTAQSIGRAMGSLVVLDRHLWLTLTDMKDAEKAVV